MENTIICKINMCGRGICKNKKLNCDWEYVESYASMQFTYFEPYVSDP